MHVKDFSEAENFINTLSNDSRLHLISTITYMLISYINQQNSLDLFSLLQKLSDLLTSENQKQLLLDVNNSVMRHLNNQGVDTFSLIPKLYGILNEENGKKMFSDINLLLEHSQSMAITNPPIALEEVKNIQKEIQETPVKPVTPANIPTPLPAAGNNKPAPPPPPPLNLSRPLPSIGAVATPNQPLYKSNNLASQKNKFSKGINMTTTGTFLIKSKNIDQDLLNVSEAIKYLIPAQTSLAKLAVTKMTTPIDIYEYLKQVNGKNSLENVYLEIYSKTDLLSFIYKTYSMYTTKYITLSKSADIPADKRLKLKIGEWMVLLGFIERDKLDRIVVLHNTAVKNEQMSRRYNSRTIMSGQGAASEPKTILFGNFLLESEIINHQQLDQALQIQTQYNELIDNLKAP